MQLGSESNADNRKIFTLGYLFGATATGAMAVLTTTGTGTASTTGTSAFYFIQ